MTRDSFQFYYAGESVYLDDEGNYYILDGKKRIVFATEEELKEYFEN